MFSAAQLSHDCWDRHTRHNPLSFFKFVWQKQPVYLDRDKNMKKTPGAQLSPMVIVSRWSCRCKFQSDDWIQFRLPATKQRCFNGSMDGTFLCPGFGSVGFDHHLPGGALHKAAAVEGRGGGGSKLITASMYDNFRSFELHPHA